MSRLDALEAEVAELRAHHLLLIEAFTRAFTAAGEPLPEALRREERRRPPLRLVSEEQPAR
jgi:hypothetical protein